jgi:MFS family permease
VGIFLVAYSLASDSILTISLYFAVVMDIIYGIDDSRKYIIMALMYLCTTVSSYLSGAACDRLGCKKITHILLHKLIAAFIWQPLLGPGILFAVAVIGGIGWGGFTPHQGLC